MLLLLLLLLLLAPVSCSCLLLTAAAIAAGTPRLLQLLLLRVTASDIAWPGPSMSSNVLSVVSTIALESRSPTGITASCRRESEHTVTNGNADGAVVALYMLADMFTYITYMGAPFTGTPLPTHRYIDSAT
jgi:hypothetical protein